MGCVIFAKHEQSSRASSSCTDPRSHQEPAVPKSPQRDPEGLKRSLNMVFDKYDLNGDQVLTRNEVKIMMLEVGQKNNKFVSEEELEMHVEDFFNKADIDHDGRIARDEFLRYYKQL
jgi:Ca2+-binding EF-hand superfamily protein